MALALALGGAPLARPAVASPWSSAWRAPAKDSPESLLERAQLAFDDGRYQESGDLAAAAYAALPLSDRASAYGENAVFQATNAYREAWLRSGALEPLVAGRELLQRHVGDYATRGRREAPASVRQELERMQLLEARAREPEPIEPAPRAKVEPDPPRPGLARPLRRGTAAAFVGDAALSLGSVLLSAFVFGYEPSASGSDVLVQVRSPSHAGIAVPLAVAGGVVGGLGMHALIDGGALPRRRKQKVGIGLTVASAAVLVAGGVLLGTGAAFWPAPENGVTSVSRANLSVNLQSIGLATMLGSLGLLGPGIGALATRPPAEGN
ncbi:MAG: hypothetical protein KDK70_36585 [Myxococcales bacterium]|nr:hypothetical protein [Myxococcales bacterium]